MVNLEMRAPLELKEYIMKLFKGSGKKHLVITGSKQIGKSTLVREILRHETEYGGIVTYLKLDHRNMPTEVVMEDILDRGKSCIIGEMTDNGMTAVSEGFEIDGVNLLKKYRLSKIETIVIDEIGFLETNAKNYQKEIMQCFRDKRIIAVIRKEDNDFLNEIKNFPNTLVVDLDQFS